MGRPEAEVRVAGCGRIHRGGVGASAEQHRFLAAAYDPITFARLARTGVRRGWRCLEVGAGGGSVAHWLAARVAPPGTVLATDLEPRFVPPARGLTVTRHDLARDPLAEREFDLVHARLVLRQLPNREDVLRRLVRALKPGGWLQVDEFDNDYAPVLLAPDRNSAALYEEYLAARDRMFSAAGVDHTWGRKVARAMTAAGLVDVDPMPVVQPWTSGSPAVRLLRLHTVELRDPLVAEGMNDDKLAAVRAVLDDDRFRASSSVFYSVLGRRPT
ncbi:methyltransferase [Actinosynnema sp. NPDC020468]|uniref:class I SAM-dependent methyltransferase n=1 Tax=Actinosynnema sp. NPDC020468 TaxID=3154488 RepID=UPI0033F3060D